MMQKKFHAQHKLVLVPPSEERLHENEIKGHCIINFKFITNSLSDSV